MKTKTKQECQIVQTKKKKPQISNSLENNFKRNSLKVEAKNKYLENEIAIIYCINYIKHWQITFIYNFKLSVMSLMLKLIWYLF